jgi:predicted lipid-binding transport protein (Tim44 family)
MMDIIIFAAVAIVLLFRLRAVLGRRTGEERQPENPFDRTPVVPFQRGATGDAAGAGGSSGAVIDNDPSAPLSLDTRLARVHAADPAFDEKHFLAGARAAFQTVVQAFAAGDLAVLRPLLSSHLYGEFGRVISERPHRDVADSVQFEGSVEAEIQDARVVGGEVQIQVRFVSRQMHAGEKDIPDETVDLWTFARAASSRDPNWQLIETALGS